MSSQPKFQTKRSLVLTGLIEELEETPRTKTYIKPQQTASSHAAAPIGPVKPKRGWPEAAIIDWEVWGHRSPPHFFAKWPELKS